jgi:hypothetical protein
MKIIDILEAGDQEDSPDDVPTYVLRDTADVAQHVYPFLVQSIEKLNKRARKNKLPEITLEIIKEFMKPSPDDEKSGRKHNIPYYTIKIAGDRPKVPGYEFIATIEHQDGGNIIRTVPGKESNKTIKDFYEAKPHYCDHCKKIRRRIDTFIIHEEKTGKLRQIGRNCLADFLGGVDPKAILAYFDNRDNILRLVSNAEEQAGKKGVRAERFVPLEDALTVGASLVRTFGYMSSKKAQEMGYNAPPTTASGVSWFLFYSPGPGYKITDREQQIKDLGMNPTDADTNMVKTMLTWWAALPEEQKESNEFMHNLNVIIKSGRVNPRNIGYACALFPVYARAMGLIKKQADTAKKSNEWIGQPKGKLPPTKIKVIRTRMISGEYGTTQIVTMEDEKGNAYVWFNNSANEMEDDKEYTITGTIKKHDEYNGRRQTNIMRVKFV